MSASRDMLLNLLEATLETAEPVSSSDSSSSSDEEQPEASSERAEAIAYLTELMQLVQRRQKAKEAAAVAAAQQESKPKSALKKSGSVYDVASNVSFAESSSTSTADNVFRMRRSYQVQASAVHSQMVDSNSSSDTTCSSAGAAIVQSWVVSEDVCVVCGLEDKGHYTKRGFKCVNCASLVDVIDSPLFMRYNPSYGDSLLFNGEGSTSTIIIRTQSGTIARTPSHQRRHASSYSLGGGSGRQRSISGSIGPNGAPPQRFLSRGDFSKSHQDPSDVAAMGVERSVGIVEASLKRFYEGRQVHALNGGISVEDVILSGPPRVTTLSSTPGETISPHEASLSFDSAKNFSLSDGATSASVWENPTRGNDFESGLYCVKNIFQYDPYGFSFLKDYEGEQTRSLRLLSLGALVSPSDRANAFTSLFRDLGTGNTFVVPYSLAASPIRAATEKQDPLAWSTEMYTHLVPKLFTDVESTGNASTPSGRMGRYMVVRRDGLCDIALSNDGLLEASPLMASLMGSSKRPSSFSGSPRKSSPTATPIHDMHALVHPNLLYMFAVAPHAASNSTFFVLENLPSLADYRVVREALTGPSVTASPSISPNVPASNQPKGRLQNAVSNVVGSFRFAHMQQEAATAAAKRSTLSHVVDTVLSGMAVRNADEEFRALAFGAVSALQAVHKCGFVHGDLRPHNFFVDPSTGVTKIRFCPAYSELPQPFSPPETRDRGAKPAAFIPTPEGDIYTLGVTLRLLRYGTTGTEGYPLAMLDADRRITSMLDAMTALDPRQRPTPSKLLEAGPLWVVRSIHGIPAVRKLLTVNILSYSDQVQFATRQLGRGSSPQISYQSRAGSFTISPPLTQANTKVFTMPTASRLYLRDSEFATSTATDAPSALANDDTDTHADVIDGLEKSFAGSFANLTANRRSASNVGFGLPRLEGVMGSLTSLKTAMSNEAPDLQRVVVPLSALSSQSAAATPRADSPSGTSSSWYSDVTEVAKAPVFILRNVHCKGAQELLKYFAACGPSYHAVRGGDGFLTLYSVLKDPRSSQE